MTKSVFSSVPEGEFYSSDRVEDESTFPEIALDYCPIRPGTLKIQAKAHGKRWEMVSCPRGGLWLVRRTWIQRLFRREGTHILCGHVDHENGRVTFGCHLEMSYRYDNEAVEGESADEG